MLSVHQYYSVKGLKERKGKELFYYVLKMAELDLFCVAVGHTIIVSGFPFLFTYDMSVYIIPLILEVLTN